ncbi:hypothetical protein [Amycolatopsis saalfeldensis]|uniref:Endonuclease/Exonuclease/phosphatase family protein n=1 Tax=Amycolatopsis saalfeldensis TaxID=394193 RepID=A0A1H8YPE8_9PSEU|nr:hypothetical protein [Amycolatopsis saalfeldensis]SEP53963.1 hypothetical protein SAMN04489732_13418 [Amycolatopsis saalfeldensis]
MTTIDLAYFNFEHGGLIGGGARGGGSGYDFTGLVRVMGEDDRWPNLFVMGEGDRYEFNGGQGKWGAVAAMRAAGGRPYVPLPCELPRQWGPFAPVIFYDAQTVVVSRFYDHRAPDFAARNSNLVTIRPVTGGDELYVTTTHGDLNDPALRESDAKAMRWLANPTVLSAILADWNEVLSGPHHEPQDLDAPHYDKPHQILYRLRRGLDGRPVEPRRLETRAMDYLCGWWDEQRDERVGGVGFHDAAELAGIYTGTNLPKPSGRQCTQIDHILLNTPLAARVVPGSTRIHEPLDPAKPDSDHKRISVTVDL